LGRVDSAVVALPIRKGNFLIGVIEFSSSEVSRLSYEVRFFELVASICGDIVRRLELANDRGWLTRMSFIHAARHRIEAIIRDLRKTDERAAKELVDLMEKGTMPKSDASQKRSFGSAILKITELLKPHTAEDRRSSMVSTLSHIDDICGISERASDLLIDIFETLLANSSHSSFKPDDISLSLRENDPSSNYLRIDYAPRGISINIERQERLCIAPIPDDSTHTFHYGLFLLSTQVRMAGGVAAGKPLYEDQFGGTPFGVSFLIPLIG
jgi:hypothetical protein